MINYGGRFLRNVVSTNQTPGLRRVDGMLWRNNHLKTDAASIAQPDTFYTAQ